MEVGLQIAAVVGLLAAVGALYAILRRTAPPPKHPVTTPQEPTDPAALWEYRFGPLNPALVCPHCQIRGRVHAKPITIDAGISGQKAGIAVLTGGVSVLATGLSQQELRTIAACENCSSVWRF